MTSSGNLFFERVGAWLFQRAVLVSCFVAAGILVAIFGLTKITINTDNKVLFSQSNPDRIALEEFEALFGRNFLAAIIVEPESGSVFDTESLTAMRWISQRAFDVPFMRRVDSITNFQHTTNAAGLLKVSPLVPASGDITTEQALDAKAIALDMPELVNAFVSPSGHVAAISVTVKFGREAPPRALQGKTPDDENRTAFSGGSGQDPSGDDPFGDDPFGEDPFADSPFQDDPFGGTMFDDIEDLVPIDTTIAAGRRSEDGLEPLTTLSFAELDQLSSSAKKQLVGNALKQIEREAKQRFPNMNYYISGRLISDVTFAEAARRDLKLLYPVMFLVMVAILGFLTRSITASLMALSVMVLTSVTTTGIFGWFGLQINVMTMPGPLVLMVLSSLASVHLLSSYFEGRRSGQDHNAALDYGVNKSIWPIFLTCLTTALGALTLNFSDSPPPRMLGNIVALGMFVMFAITFTVGIAILKLRPITNYQARVGAQLLFMGFGERVVRHARILAVAGTALVVVLCFGMLRIVFDDHFIRYFNSSFDFRVDTDFAEQNLTGMNGIEFALDTGQRDGIFEPEYLETVDAFSAWLRDQDHVVYVHSVTDILKRVNRTLHDENPDHYKLQTSSEQAAQHMIFYTSGLPSNKGMDNRKDIENSVTRIYASAAQLSAQDLRDLARKSEAWLAENASEYTAKPTGMALMFAKIAQRNVLSMVFGTFIALVLVSLAMRIAVGTWPYTLMSMVPNLVPMMVSFGIWGWLIGEVNMAISFVGAFTLGIVVDDTVHFLVAYTRSRGLGRSARQAVVESFLHIGPALFTTSIILVIGFGVLSFSGFAINGSLGQLSVITVAVALVSDFLLLPAILVLVDREPARGL